MASDGTTFQIDIDAPTASAERAASKVELLAAKLAEAGEASSAASNAVKAAEAAYRQTEGAADRAAKSLEKVNVSLDAQRGKMAAAMAAGDDAAYARAAAAAEKLTKRQAEAAEAAEKAKAAVAAEAAALDRLRASAATASEQHDHLTKKHADAKKAAEALKKAQDAAAGSGKFKDLADGAKKLGGPIGRLGDVAGGASEGFSKLTGSLGAAVGPYAALAVVVIAVTTALIAGTAAVLRWSIGLSDANRSARLLSDGIAGSVAGGRELDAAIKSLERRVPQTSDELRSMAADLAKTGLKGQALTNALEDTATKAAKLKWGPDFAKGAVSLDKLSARLKGNIAGIFGGLNLDKFAGALGRIVDLFDETSITGKAIKVVFESLFQPLVDGLTKLEPKIVAAFIQFQIWVLKALIAIKPFGSTIVMVAKVVGAAFLAVVAAIAVVIGVIVAVNAAAMVLAAGLMYLGVKFVELVTSAVAFAAAIISEPGKALTWLQEKFNEVVAFLSGLSLAELGSQLIQGLVSGIMSGGAAVVSSVTGVVSNAIDAAKSALGIASPSKVFAEIGAYTAEGMAGGVEEGAGQVQSSIESMVEPPAPGAGGAAAGSGGGGTYYLTFQFSGGDAEANAKAAREQFVEFLESIGVVAGTAVAG